MYVIICTCECVLSHSSRVRLCVTPWTVACQAPLSTGVSRWEYWSELLSSRGSSKPGIKHSFLCLLHWQAGSLPLVTLGKPKIICIPIFKSKSLAGYLKNEPEFNQTSLVSYQNHHDLHHETSRCPTCRKSWNRDNNSKNKEHSSFKVP